MPQPDNATVDDSMNLTVNDTPGQVTLPDPTPYPPSTSNTPSSESTRPPYHHQYSSSTSITQSKSRRSLASLAREKTSNAFANLASIGTTSTPSLRSATSSGSLGKHSTVSSSVRPILPRSPTSPEVHSTLQRRTSGIPLPSQDPRTSTTIPPMPPPDRNNGRMHQTSSKILRMTDDERPFTRDFKDLFATLITSLPLTPHRVRFSRVEETFLAEEAITNLGSLKFSQSNRIPDPKNPTRWVVTTTTTTFSMAKEMARSVCQRFVDARLIESAENKSITTFATKGGVWQLTAKGLAILARFCSRNGINARHVEPLLKRSQMQIVSLERDPSTDKILQDRATVEIIFRRFMGGSDGPNVKSSTSLSDSDSVSEYVTGLVGVKMAKERRVMDKIVNNTFTGKAASDWVLDCTTTIDRRETYEIAELFVKWQLMVPIVEDRAYIRVNPMATYFQPTRYAIYAATERGQRACGWLARPASIDSEDSRDPKEKSRVTRDSNVGRLNVILQDAALRLLFKEFLRQSLCEENLQFYFDVSDFITNYRNLDEGGRLSKPEAVRETLAAAYGLYNSFLASGAPSELNIDHSLRNRLDSRMIRTNTDDDAMRESLDEVVELFELAQGAVFKLMASDSVPKFLRDPRNATVLREHEIDITAGSNRALSPAPEQSVSRSNTHK
ncbi:regulator of G protein signaling domain-containing protein [Exophiala viscosa]|uniref:Regulator of G protein signaling domain-containing protein n=1 Tax=Exophiala viscosa TaxID=2486360 RepID=A0AAN6E858_9EURO|nr:regulator of G protein signaling domain-containing protein [Exophiala viscosa]KAI1628153.1 regulator of G protein signaling domain-containing protein [Exophiala viscosa]